MGDLGSAVTVIVGSQAALILAKSFADTIRWRQDRADRIQRQKWLDSTMNGNHQETLTAVQEVKDTTLSLQDKTDILRGLAEELGYDLTKHNVMEATAHGGTGTADTDGAGAEAGTHGAKSPD